MKKIAVSILFFAAVILVLSVSALILNNINLEKKIFYTSVNITDRTGFDVNSTALTFGKMSHHGSSTRNFVFKNEYNFPVIAKINVKGDIEKFLYYDEYVRIETGERKEIPFSAVSNDVENVGFYEGEVEFLIKPV